MAKDNWLDGKANWDTPGDWSAGLPGPSSDVVIANLGGVPEVTASFGTVASISILRPTGRHSAFIDAGASSVDGDVTNTYGLLFLDRIAETEGRR